MQIYISKTLWALVQPSSLIAIFLAAGLILMGRRIGRLLLGLGAALYLICGFSPLGNWLLIPLEFAVEKAPAADLERIAGIIVLGGAVIPDLSHNTGGVEMNEAAERMTEALRLAKERPDVPLIFTGGYGGAFATGPTEADAAKRFFNSFGIKEPRLRLENRSRNTAENAAFTAALLKPERTQKWLLVTSSFHMRRAKALFEAHNFTISPWPVDYRTHGPADRWSFFSQASEGLRRVDLAAKEWAGWYILRLREYIAAHQ